jgi:hypothetical protein
MEVFHSGCDCVRRSKQNSQLSLFGCTAQHVKHSADGIIGGVLAVVQSKCNMQEPTRCSRKRWATRVKAGHGTPECVSMHDEKRPKWRNRVRAWRIGHAGVLGDLQISRGRGACMLQLHLPRAREGDTQDELNTTQKCSVLYSLHVQANKRRFNGNSQALQYLERESRHDNDLNVEVCSKLAACSLANQRRLRQY